MGYLLCQEHRAVDDHAVAWLKTLQNRNNLSRPFSDQNFLPLKLPGRAFQKDIAASVFVKNSGNGNHGHLLYRSWASNAGEHLRPKPSIWVFEFDQNLQRSRIRV